MELGSSYRPGPTGHTASGPCPSAICFESWDPSGRATLDRDPLSVSQLISLRAQECLVVGPSVHDAVPGIMFS